MLAVINSYSNKLLFQKFYVYNLNIQWNCDIRMSLTNYKSNIYESIHWKGYLRIISVDMAFVKNLHYISNSYFSVIKKGT
jgi:hypothetical protein